MATVAEQLRRAREAQRLSIYQVAETTKMKSDHVRALEAGDYDSFVAPIYIRGFVRTYGTLLKLDVAPLLSTLEQELGQHARFREPPALSREPPGALDLLLLRLSRIPWKIALPVLAVLALAAGTYWGVRVWQDRRARDPLAGVEPGVYAPPPQPAGETLPVAPAPPPRR